MVFRTYYALIQYKLLILLLLLLERVNDLGMNPRENKVTVIKWSRKVKVRTSLVLQVVKRWEQGLKNHSSQSNWWLKCLTSVILVSSWDFFVIEEQDSVMFT